MNGQEQTCHWNILLLVIFYYRIHNVNSVQWITKAFDAVFIVWHAGSAHLCVPGFTLWMAVNVVPIASLRRQLFHSLGPFHCFNNLYSSLHKSNHFILERVEQLTDSPSICVQIN